MKYSNPNAYAPMRSPSLWRSLPRPALAALLAAAAPLAAHAYNHNPDLKDKNTYSTATLDAPSTAQGNNGSASYSFTISIEGGAAPGTVQWTISPGGHSGDASSTSATLNYSKDGVCEYSLTVTGTGDSTYSDSRAIKISAGGGGSGSGASMGSVRAFSGVGNTENGEGGGRLLLESTKDFPPDPKLATPAGLILTASDGVERIFDPFKPGVIRQTLTDDTLVDIVTLDDKSYEMRYFPADNKGSKDGQGLYQPVGDPFKIERVENPGGPDILGTNDDLLYQSARIGAFWYRNELPPGDYLLDLHFAEIYLEQPGLRAITVEAEGQELLAGLDLVAQAGALTAHDRAFGVTVADGEINLHLLGAPGIEDAGRGGLLSAYRLRKPAPDLEIAGTDDDLLYRSERWGDFAYSLPGLAPGNYRVTLYFADRYFAAPGSRAFDVSIEGSVVWDELDIAAQAGGANTALVWTHDAAVDDGTLNIEFAGTRKAAKLAALKVERVTIDATDPLNPVEVLALIDAVNAGGPAHTNAAGVVFAADHNFSGGQIDGSGGVLAAVNCGGPAFTAADGTAFQADSGFTAGNAYDVSFSRLILTTEQGAASTVAEYNWQRDLLSERVNYFELTTGNGLKTERRQRVWSQDRLSYTETTTLRDAQDNIASAKEETYEKLAFGFAKVRETLDPQGAALTTTWTYHEGTGVPGDPLPNGFGRVAGMQRYDGYWETRDYDDKGNLVKLASSHLNSPFGIEASARVETTSYSEAVPQKTVLVTVAGQEIERRYRAVIEQGAEFEIHTIQATESGAAWNAPSNLATITRHYQSNHPVELLRGKRKWVRRPDGTMAFYSYSLNAGEETTTEDSGQPNAAKTAIVDGARTVTVRNAAGEQIAEQTIDIASGLLLAGWQAMAVDDRGRPTLFAYSDGTSRAVAYRDGEGCSSCGGSDHLIESETDRRGVTTLHDYDALGRRTSVSQLGVGIRIVHDAADREIERFRAGNGTAEVRIERQEYDQAGRLIATWDAMDNQTSYSYSYPTGGGAATTATLPPTAGGSGTRVETIYADGQTREISGSAVAPMRYEYGTHASGRWTKEIKIGEGGSETEWTRTLTDMVSRRARVEYPDAAAAESSYNALGQLVRETDPDGVTTLHAYNGQGERETSAIDMDRDGLIDFAGPDRVTRTLRDVRNKNGTVVRRTTTQVWAADNQDTPTTASIVEQDGHGNRAWQTDAAGAVTHTASLFYEQGTGLAPGEWTTTTTRPDGAQTVERHANGRLTESQTKNSAGAVVTSTIYAYDPLGRLASQTDARTGQTSFAYNNRDELLSETRPAPPSGGGDLVTAYTYDALGNRLTQTLPDGGVTTNEYHLRGNLLKKSSGSQTYTQEYTYDPQGRMKTLTTAGAAGPSVTTWNYDPARGWLAAKVYHDGQGPAYTYTAAGRLLTRLWARGITTTYGYDNAVDLVSTDYSDATPDIAIVRDRLGRESNVSDAAGGRAFAYNTNLTLRSETVSGFFGQDKVLTRAYDPSVPGRNRGFSIGTSADPDGDYAVIYGYDSAGRLASVNDGRDTTTYTYATNSNLLASRSSSASGLTAAFIYEPHRDALTVVDNKAGGVSLSKYTYAYNRLGQRESRAQTGTAFVQASTDSFGYNVRGEVVSSSNSADPARAAAYEYDPIGNRLSSQDMFGATAYTPNTLNQYLNIDPDALPAFAPVHDADGNLVETARRTDGKVMAYTWNGENQLVAVEPAAPAAGDKRLEFAYDHRGRRIEKRVFEWSGSWALTRHEKFLYDDWNMTAVYNAATGNALARTFTWGLDLSGSLQGAGGVGGLVSSSVAGQSPLSYSYDANGNVSELVDTAGTGVAHYEYDPFGNVVFQTGSLASGNPYRFSTKFHDSETGLVYYGYRYYSPKTGRWLSRDPIDERGGLNLYLFGSNNSINLFDGLGDLAQCAPLLLNPGTWTLGPWILVAAGAVLIYEAYDHREELWQLYTEMCGACVKAQTETKTVTRTRIRKKGDKWSCECKCNCQITPWGRENGVTCPDRTHGSGYGPTEKVASQAACDVAQGASLRGCYARHCHAYNCKKQ